MVCHDSDMMKYVILIEVIFISLIFAALPPPPKMRAQSDEDICFKIESQDPTRTNILKLFSFVPVLLDPFKHYLDKVRCTRRYSVGECPEPVVPVWTYVAHLQNCTERLGCHSATISNRFPTLAMCMRKCRPLRDLYTMLIAETNLTGSGLRSSKVSVGRRDEGLQDEDYPERPLYPEAPGASEPPQFHTEPVTQDESYGDAPPEVEFWEG